MSTIVDPAATLDVAQFDAVVAQLSSQNPNAVMEAQLILTQFRENSDNFFRADRLIMESTNPTTRFMGVQVLEDGILKRWNIYTESQRKFLIDFLMNVITGECTSVERVRSQRRLLTKLNSALVSIAKREWPLRWPTFVKDICNVELLDQPITENTVHLLSMLGEDIFEFGEKGMTSRWIKRKKEALQSDFGTIHTFLGSILTRSGDVQVIQASLLCLATYLPWMPFELVFDMSMIQFLVETFLPAPQLRSSVLRCLTEIAAMPIAAGAAGERQKQCVVAAFRTALTAVVDALPTNHGSVEGRIAQHAESFEQECDIIGQWVIATLKNYIRAFAHDEVLLLLAHQLVIGLTHVESKEIFKMCVDYWWWLGDLLVVGSQSHGSSSNGGESTGIGRKGQIVAMLQQRSTNTVLNQIEAKLHRVLSNARFVLIKRMAKPEEVIVVEEEGELHREHMKDVETLQLYEVMREALVFLTNLDQRDTCAIMQKMMNRQLDGSEWSWANCSALCWAVGAISGAMGEEAEKDLFVAIVRDLLHLCKEMQGKENRAVIASNIMYVVGQYPRFLRTHVSFFKTVARKLFEFMLETFAGVQDMAVDTFFKLAKVVPEVMLDSTGEPQPFVCWVIDNWRAITKLLSPAHIQTCYKAMGCAVNAQSKIATARGSTLLFSLLANVTADFHLAAQYAHSNFSDLCANSQLLRSLLHLLRCYSAVASTCGPVFLAQMEVIFVPLQEFYILFSQAVSQATADAIMSDAVPLGRLIKREALRVIEQFVIHADETQFVATQCMPKIFESVLTDYTKAVPAARDAGVLALVNACVVHLKGLLSSDVAAILDHTFDPTVSMLINNMEDMIDHRVQLFQLLRSLNEHCFDAFLAYVTTHEDVLNSVLWAIKHSERNVMHTGLELLDTFLTKVLQSPLAESFFTAYSQRILTEVLVGLLDTLHVSGFPLHCNVLMQVFKVSSLIPAETPSIGLNAVLSFFQENLGTLPTLTPQQISSLVENCYAKCHSVIEFRQLFSDFLVEVRVWGAEEENRLLKEEERAALSELVPGFASMGHKPEYS